MTSTIRKQLRDGVELRSPFDSLSYPANIVIGFAAFVGAILMTMTGFGFDLRLAGTLAIWSVSQGAFLHSHLPRNALPGLGGDTPWRFGPVMHMIKDPGARYIHKHLV